MTDDEQLYQKRMGFWLRMARERAGKSQQGAAEHLGFSTKSKSTISDYENGVTAVPLRNLRRLADWYGVPLEVFTHPEPTTEERLDQLARAAVAQERAGWERDQATDLDAGDGHGEQPDTRSA